MIVPENVAGEASSMPDLLSVIDELRRVADFIGVADNMDRRFRVALDLAQKYARQLDAVNAQLVESRLVALLLLSERQHVAEYLTTKLREASEAVAELQGILSSCEEVTCQLEEIS